MCVFVAGRSIRAGEVGAEVAGSASCDFDLRLNLEKKLGIVAMPTMSLNCLPDDHKLTLFAPKSETRREFYGLGQKLCYQILTRW